MKNAAIIAFLALALVVGTLYAADNYVDDGEVISLQWANVSPLPSAPVVKSAAKSTGGIVGVALTGTGTLDEVVSVATKGVFTLSVTASPTISSIAVGDYVYTTVGGIGTCTAALSNDSDGLLFGVALDAALATTTSPITRSIRIRLVQPGHL